MTIVADTHVLIWYFSQNPKLSATVNALLEQTEAQGGVIYLASISIVEIIYLIERSKIPLTAFDQLKQFLLNADSTWQVIPLDLAIAQTLQHIDRITVPEMPDRIIAATALHLNLPLVTRDHKIQALQNVQTIW